MIRCRKAQVPAKTPSDLLDILEKGLAQPGTYRRLQASSGICMTISTLASCGCMLQCIAEETFSTESCHCIIVACRVPRRVVAEHALNADSSRIILGTSFHLSTVTNFIQKQGSHMVFTVRLHTEGTQSHGAGQVGMLKPPLLQVAQRKPAHGSSPFVTSAAVRGRSMR